MIKSITVENPKKETLVLELTHPEKSGIYVKSVEGLGPGKSIVNVNEIATSDGGVFASSRMNARNIILTLGMMFDPLIEDARHKIYKYFPIKKSITLTIETDYRTSFIEGYVESNEPDIFSEEETAQISLICPNPWFYDTGGSKDAFSGVENLFEFPFSNEIEYSDGIDLLHPISEIMLIQEGSGIPSFDNIRNISGWSNISLTCNGETTNQSLPETVYGGMYDWLKGVLTITHRGFLLPISAMNDGVQNYPGWDRRNDKLDISTFDLTNINVRDNSYIDLKVTGNCLPIIGINTQSKDDCSLSSARIQFNKHSSNPIYPDLTVAELKAQYPNLVFQFVAPLKPEYIRTISLPVHEFLALSGTNAVSANCGPTSFTIDHEIRGNHIIFGDIRQGTVVGINYKGDIDTGVLMRIRFGEVTDKMIIYNVDTSEKMTLWLDRIADITGEELNKKDEIEISTFTGSKYIYLWRNGQYYNIFPVLDHFASWFKLSAGVNQFAFSANGHESDIIIEFTYKNMYGGI